jgi:GntR family transcriptional regulator
MQGKARMKGHETGALNRMSFIPLYHQIQQIILEKILKGELMEGDMLYSEPELSRLFNVSRMTARQALGELKRNGHAVSHRGRGTFVQRARKKVPHSASLYEEESKPGQECILLSKKILQPDELKEQAFQPHGTEPFVRLERAYKTKQSYVAVENIYLPLNRFPKLDELKLSKQPVCDFLRLYYPNEIAWITETILIRKPKLGEARVLAIKTNSHVASVTRLLLNHEEEHVGYIYLTCSAKSCEVSTRFRIKAVASGQ